VWFTGSIVHRGSLRSHLSSYGHECGEFCLYAAFSSQFFLDPTPEQSATIRQSSRIEVTLTPPCPLPLDTDRQEDIARHHDKSGIDAPQELQKRTQEARRGNGKMSFLVFALAPANAIKQAGIYEPKDGQPFRSMETAKRLLYFGRLICLHFSPMRLCRRREAFLAKEIACTQDADDCFFPRFETTVRLNA
jgi:hypothetical protein